MTPCLTLVTHVLDQVEWGGANIASALSDGNEDISFEVRVIAAWNEEKQDDDIEERPILTIDLTESALEAVIDLSEGIFNNDGQFEVRLDRAPKFTQFQSA
ncbi:uncharacterized protein N7496_002595 [Penicillium cataractarum]|uniref:Uncharacterized protein n=1 Tax=Penicillium cataractarum TaxID=2100454 RepID=A0A9W9SKJ1_9EURO|nr:uncharacterized protein N7496_002595 [Penicillium cataractarum]KAJ5380167.1 hypothetical protein N7496_002595 [Penicillium cataractarum]